MNILFLMTDQQRYDCIGYAPNSKVPTPHMDRIAEGMAFLNCQTVNPICQPARTALLTGRYSHQIGTLRMSGDLNFDTPTYPQALQKAGYWTAGVGKFHYLQTWFWNRPMGQGLALTDLRAEMESLGYDYVWQTAGKQQATRNYCDYCAHMEAREQLAAYREWVIGRGANRNFPDAELDKDGDAWPFKEEDHIDIVTGRKIRDAIDARDPQKPFFIFGSFCSPHKPFDPPQRFLDEEPYEEVDDFLPDDANTLTLEQKKTLWRLRRSYKATIRLLDEEIGKIFDKLEADGLLEDTVIILTSDHGEMMGDHYRIQKSSYYRESQNVPLAIRHPHFLNGSRNDQPVEITDVTGTICDLAGLDPQEALSRDWPAFNNQIPCRSLLPVLAGEQSSVRDFAFSEFSDVWKSITTADYKYVKFLEYDSPEEGPEERLYDLRKDPREQVNLVGQAELSDVLELCRRRLQWVLDQTLPMQHRWAPLIQPASRGD